MTCLRRVVDYVQPTAKYTCTAATRCFTCAAKGAGIVIMRKSARLGLLLGGFWCAISSLVIVLDSSQNCLDNTTLHRHHCSSQREPAKTINRGTCNADFEALGLLNFIKVQCAAAAVVTDPRLLRKVVIQNAIA
jgi:hypothetical protein